MRVDAIGATLTHGGHFACGQPIKIVFIPRIEVFASSSGITHGVELVTVFNTRSTTNNALTRSLPKISVVESIVMS